MDRAAWSAKVPDGEAHRRAGGRRRHNAWRRFARLHRRLRLTEEMRETGMGRGYQAELARRLGVHRSTVHRDLRWLFRQVEEERLRAWWESQVRGGADGGIG